MWSRLAPLLGITAWAVLLPVTAHAAVPVDGSIAYARYRPAQHTFAVRILDPVSGHTDWVASGSSPAWSPNGRRLAFVGAAAHVAVRNADGSVTRTGVPAAIGSDMAWSPDGSRLAFGYSDHVWLMNIRAPYDPHQLSAGMGYAPSWSPDSSRIVYSGYDDNIVSDLRVVNADGTGDVDVTATPDIEESRPDWSPDGTSFAYLAVLPQQGVTGLFVSDADGSDAHMIFSTFKFCCGSPDWSPTATRIAFIGNTGLTIVNTDGTNPRVLTDDNAYQLDWQNAAGAG